MKNIPKMGIQVYHNNHSGRSGCELPLLTTQNIKCQRGCYGQVGIIIHNFEHFLTFSFCISTFRFCTLSESVRLQNASAFWQMHFLEKELSHTRVPLIHPTLKNHEIRCNPYVMLVDFALVYQKSFETIGTNL